MTRVPTPEYRGLLDAAARARDEANRLCKMAGRSAGPSPSELRAAIRAEEAAEDALGRFSGKRYEEGEEL